MRFTYKRLAKHGNSLLVPIPALMCHELSWLKGDHVVLVLDEIAGTITLKKQQPVIDGLGARSGAHAVVGTIR